MTTISDITALIGDYTSEQVQAATDAQTAKEPLRTRYGYTISKPLATLQPILGAPGIVRVYDNGKGITKAASNAPADLPACLSWHSDPAQTAAGATDDAITTAVKPNNIYAWLHEFDKYIVKGSLDYALYSEAFDHVAAVVHSAGGTVAQIFTGWDIGNRAQWVRPTADLIGIDPYARNTGQTAAELVTPCIDAIRQHTDAKIAVCEIGTSASDVPAFAESVAELHGLVDHVCWFNTRGPFAGGTDYSIDGNSEAAAIWRTLTRLPA